MIFLFMLNCMILVLLLDFSSFTKMISVNIREIWFSYTKYFIYFNKVIICIIVSKWLKICTLLKQVYTCSICL